MRLSCTFIVLSVLLVNGHGFSQKPGKDFSVIAYYSGDASNIDKYRLSGITHIIFSFGHLKGNRLSIARGRDSASVTKLVSYKRKFPNLKIILSLGGWGGCKTCSPVFATENGRKEFAGSVKLLLQKFGADGIDLDWEYPAIEGYPGHAYMPEDRDNFTLLVRTLRDSLGKKYEISFAAGAFDKYLQASIDWQPVMKIIDKLNLMSYDLVGGYSPITGHHTPLYSTTEQKQSLDNAIKYLDSAGVPMHKVIIGAAFYARIWDSVAPLNRGLYQKGKFRSFIAYKDFPNVISKAKGYEFYRDSIAHAPFAYNTSGKLFATFDDDHSVREKTRYAIDKKLGGIMFWELTLDKTKNGLLDVIRQEISRF